MRFNPGAAAFNTALPLGYRRSLEAGDLRVVVVAAQTEVRLELRRLLDADGIDVVGEAAGCVTAIEQVVTLMPDLVFLAMEAGGSAPGPIAATIEAIRAVPEAPE